MEENFVKADSSNLPAIDAIMVANFFAANQEFCSATGTLKLLYIQRMMYGLGDFFQPLESTAALVEIIVLDQLKRLIIQAEEIANDMRAEDIIGPEDILFLMRKNEPALKRLITYLGIKDEKAVMCKALSELVKIGFDDTLKMEDEPAPVQWKKSRKGYCLDFLKTIGIEESDLNMAEDSTKERRQIRANNRSIHLSIEAYEEYRKARCTSFTSADMGSQKFLSWLSAGGVRQTLTTPVAEILVYLAKEIVANLIDMAITLREENIIQELDSPLTTTEILEVLRRCTFQHALAFACFSRDLPCTANRKVFTL